MLKKDIDEIVWFTDKYEKNIIFIGSTNDLNFFFLNIIQGLK